MIGNFRTAILITIGDNRSTIVLVLDDQVQLIAMPGAHLVGPQAVFTVKGDVEQVAMASGPEGFRQLSGILEGVVVRHTAIVIQANDLA